MTKNVRTGTGIALLVLSIFLFFSCDITLNESIDSVESLYSIRTAAGNLFSITRNGVQLTGTLTGSHAVTLTMYNTQNTATVAFILNIYYANTNLYTSSPKSFTLYKDVPINDYFYVPADGYISLANIVITRP
jgi:hypothetical protein